MSSFWDFVGAQCKTLPLLPAAETVTGGTYIITGGSTGLGFECAKHLAHIGASRVIIAVRSVQKGEAAIAAIRKATGRKDIGEVWQLDLTSLDSVEDFALKIEQLDRLDALVENDGVALDKFSLADGMETTLTVNVAATMLLALRAMPKFKQTVKKFCVRPHLVVVTSTAAFEMKGVVEGIQGGIFEALSSRTTNMQIQYPVTKLLQIYAARQLAALLPVSETGIVINAVNPGLCTTELSRNTSWVAWAQTGVMRQLVGRSAEQGSRTLLHGAVAGPDSHGKYLADCEIKEHLLPEWMQSEVGAASQQRVWMDLVKTLNSRGHKIENLGQILG